MKTHYHLLGLFLLLNISACKNVREETSVEPKNKPSILYTIDADNTKELIDLKLSDLTDSIRLVPLETNKQCLLDKNTHYYVSNKYILAYAKDGVYKFSKNGKFIDKFVTTGHGPGEIFRGAGSSTFVVDEKKDLLYIYDQMKDQRFLIYDIITGRFIGAINKAFKGYGTFSPYNDSLIISSYIGYKDSINYAAYVQNINGDFISAIRHNKQMLNSNDKKVYQMSLLHIADTCFRISFSRNDTLFTIKDKDLIPYLALKFDRPRENPPKAKGEEGSRFIEFPNAEAHDFMIVAVSIKQDIIRYDGGAAREKNSMLYLYFDKTTGKGTRIGTYSDDLIGAIYDVQQLSKQTDVPLIKFPEVLSNGKFVIAYSPYEIMEAVEKGADYENYSIEIKSQLLNIAKNIKEMDNPILLTGVPRKK